MIDAIEFQSPESMAKRLAGYMSCPSKIVAATANEFGRDRAVSRERAQALIDWRKAQTVRASAGRIVPDSPKHDGEDFTPALKVAPKEERAPFTFKRPDFGSRLPFDLLLIAVAAAFDEPVDEILSPRRSATLVNARAVLVRILRDRGHSFPKIGQLLHRTDHSTIINAWEKFDFYNSRDPRVLAVYNALRDDR